MVLSAATPRDPTRLVTEVPKWIANTRKEAHRALGELEVGVRRAVEEAAAAIASRSGGESELPTIDDIQQDSLRFLGHIGPILDVLAERMVHVLGAQIRPLEALGTELRGVPEASIRAARAGWDRAIRAYAAAVGQYVAGYVEGGGIAFAVWTELPPELAGHTGEVASILAERLAFVTKRAEGVVSSWLTEVHREIEDLLISMAPTATSEALDQRPPTTTTSPPTLRRPLTAEDVPLPAPLPPSAPPPAPMDAGSSGALRAPGSTGTHRGSEAEATPPTARRTDPGPAPTTADLVPPLLARAEKLGVRVKNLPSAPSTAYLQRLGSELDAIEARNSARAAEQEGRNARLADLIRFAEQLRMKVREVPAAPTDGYLEKMTAKLVEVATRKGVALPPTLGGPTPLPATDAAALDAAVTAETPPGTGVDDHERRARVEALIEKAMEAGVDLGRVPSDPSMAWIVVTEGKLQAAVSRRRDERQGRRKSREAERRARIERLHHQADQLGIELDIPAFPTDEWLSRAELRIAAMVLTPGGGAPPSADRAERFNRIYAQALANEVSLGTIPPDPDDVWLAWAEARIGEAGLRSTPAPGVPTATLVFEEGTIQEQRWPVGDAPLTVGRARENVVQIRDDAGVSRKHCTIRRVEGRFVLRDEGSTKGTYVDGRRIAREFVLRGGEKLSLGESSFAFRVNPR